jgi:GT2 family glycosyltransferase
MVKFSIIIVSYNVKYFLEQCLYSVKKAIARWSTDNSEWGAEVFVVDNNSPDQSLLHISRYFPSVHFISNRENIGFAKANNQALQRATGQYILFLNPDTIIPEDFFTKCQDHMETNQGAGALGVQMIDGSGKFLKESKRGFPTTWVSFCKLSGLTALLPQSKLFAKYYLGHLDKNTNHKVEALSGACMLVRAEALVKTGGFDERFFMYAEDIDLSYRIQQSGYTNLYFADVSILHFKGESTKKDIRYVKLFYMAMVQFVQKHHAGTKGELYTRILKLAIVFRALYAIASLKLSRTKSGNKLAKPNISFQGDERSIEEAMNFLRHSAQVKLAQNVQDSSEIILCEGDRFSFKDVIRTISTAPERNYKIHSFGSSGIVGSSNSRYTGEVITRQQAK